MLNKIYLHYTLEKRVIFDVDHEIGNIPVMESDESKSSVASGFLVLHQHHMLDATEHAEILVQILIKRR